MSIEAENDTPSKTWADTMKELAEKSGNALIVTHIREAIRQVSLSGRTRLGIPDFKVLISGLVHQVTEDVLKTLETDGVTATFTETKVRIGPWWWFKSHTYRDLVLEW
jgi:hypothetical protein